MWKSSRVAELRGELDALYYDRDNCKWDDFIHVRVSKVAFDAIDAHRHMYSGNSAFTASYMLLDGLCRDEFKELYKKTYKMSRVNAIIRLVAHKYEFEGIKMPEVMLTADAERDTIIPSRSVRIYAPLYIFMKNLANDMEVDASHLASVLILGGSTKDAYKNAFMREIQWLKKYLVMRFEVNLGLIRALIYLGDCKDLLPMADKLAKQINIEKKLWRVLIPKDTIELIRKAKELEGVTLGEIVTKAVLSLYFWIDL